MIVRFLSLGPTNSVFSIPCVQRTDSWYVAHSEDLLYRPAYDMFTQKTEQSELFCILHSAGKMKDGMISIESEKKRIYIDYTKDTIYSVNTQYAGNTVGLKKLALCLTIRKADKEGWLAEHMLLMGVHGSNGRKTYLAGAFPSACGKTSTAMLPRETILGDDIAYGAALETETTFAIIGKEGVPENLVKLERVVKFHRENLADAPQVLFEVLSQQRDCLLKAQKCFGDYISPESLEL